MSPLGKHVALVSWTFDPFLRDGASKSVLTRLRFLKEQGCQTSILSLLTSEIRYKLLSNDSSIVPANAQVVKGGIAYQGHLQGIPFYQEMLPFSWQERRPIVRAMMNRIQRQNIDYVLTLDEDYYPLLAAWLVDIPGAHLFNCSLAIEKFAAHVDYVRFLRGRVILANSHFIQSRIRAILGLDSVVWYPFINLQDYRVRREKGKTKTIGFCSTQGWVKGNEIVSEIAKHLPDYSFLVVGNAHRHRTGEIPGNLIYWGYIPDMKRFYKRIDLLLVPSLVEEAFGRVILEAMVNGIPVIANRVGGIPEALGDSGILIDWNRSQEPGIAAIVGKYVSAIRRILADDELYDHYSRQALARAEKFEAEQERQAQEIYDKYICPALGPA